MAFSQSLDTTRAPRQPSIKRAALPDHHIAPNLPDLTALQHNTDLSGYKLLTETSGYLCEQKLLQREQSTFYRLTGNNCSKLILKINTIYETALREYNFFKELTLHGPGITPLIIEPMVRLSTNTYGTILEHYDESLLQFLKASTSISESIDKATLLAKKCIQLHALGIVYTDLSPENVVLKGDDINLTAFERSFHFGHNYCSLIQSYLYRAPEVFISTNPNSFNQKVDVWSFGCLIYEMITKELLLKGVTSNFCGTEIEIFPAILSLLGRPPESIIESKEALNYLISSHRKCIPIDIYDYPCTRPLNQVEYIIYESLTSRISAQKKDEIRANNSIALISKLLAEILQWDPKLRPSMAYIRQQLIKIDFSMLCFKPSQFLNIQYNKKNNLTRINGRLYKKRKKAKEGPVSHIAFSAGKHPQRVIYHTDNAPQTIEKFKKIQTINLSSENFIYSEIIAIDFLSDGFTSSITAYHPSFLRFIKNKKNSFEDEIYLAKKLCSLIRSMINYDINQCELRGLACYISPKTKETEFRLNHHSESKQRYITSSAPEDAEYTNIWDLGHLIYLLFTKNTLLETFTSEGNRRERSELFLKKVFQKHPAGPSIPISKVYFYEYENEPISPQEILLTFINAIESHTNYSKNQVHQIASLLTFILQYDQYKRPSIDEILKHPLFTATAE